MNTAAAAALLLSNTNTIKTACINTIARYDDLPSPPSISLSSRFGSAHHIKPRTVADQPCNDRQGHLANP